MRILRLTIDSWRNLRGVDLEIPHDSPLVCLVGENGTGKSAVLELLSAAAHALGISQGVETNRGNAFTEPHDVSILVQIPIDEIPQTLETLSAEGLSWDGQLRLISTHSQGRQFEAIGISDPSRSASIGQGAIEELRTKRETQHLFLDADRAYPPRQFQPQQLVEIWSQDYRAPEFNRQWSYRPTRTLYEEWLKYLVGTEERTGAQLVADTRSARAAGHADPVFVDPFENYRDLLAQTLPHLRFVGIQTAGAQRTVLFDSVGLNLTFDQLSGGEREVAFLVGQVDRFKLQQGLLLVDEPELHLNPDLLRNWLAFLRDTIQDGQVWFATHSLEAVEVAGPGSTFVFERQPDTRLVVNPRLLAGRPVMSALSAAIGSPAFSLAKLRFVFIEGDRQTRERERFYAVAGEPEINRFLEGGGCEEVLRRLRMVSELAGETGEQLRVGGVIDRDFRTDSEVVDLEASEHVHVLGCHEIENVFLDPASIGVLLDRRGADATQAPDVVRNASNRFAGLWIVDRAPSRFRGQLTKSARTPIAGADRDEILREWTNLRHAAVSAMDGEEQTTWGAALDAARDEWEAQRVTGDWWKRCLGKQTLSALGPDLGFSSGEVLEQYVVRLWENGEVARPVEVENLRQYLNDLSA